MTTLIATEPRRRLPFVQSAFQKTTTLVRTPTDAEVWRKLPQTTKSPDVVNVGRARRSEPGSGYLMSAKCPRSVLAKRASFPLVWISRRIAA
ncbi:hypothetical protein CA54_61400 [Symmachiella macrocystis]|uniref:Uncharacterized protein n=1 Tax=Symmachiella macrocystis TaxID=2527985 RepID=A0A5C6AVH7_9PLAN|nr:hypothetical protein CA54_61400 [Symmachiella macrocystis]